MMFVKGDPDKVIIDAFKRDPQKPFEKKVRVEKYLKFDSGEPVKVWIPGENDLFPNRETLKPQFPSSEDEGVRTLNELRKQTESGRQAVSYQGFVDLVKRDIEDAEDYFESHILESLLERLRMIKDPKGYYASKWPKLTKRCSMVSSDIRDTIEWMLPSLIKIFLGGSDVVVLKGRTEEDKPEVLQALINFQLLSLNKGHQIFYQWFRDALEAGKGVVKAWWLRDYETVVEDVIVGVDSFLAIPDELIEDVVEMVNGEYWVKLRYNRLLKNQPVIKNIPPGEYIRSPEVDDFGNPFFAAHRSYVTASELLRLEKLGVYSNVKTAMEKSNAGIYSAAFDEIEQLLRPYRTGSGFTKVQEKDEARKLYLRYECFGWYDTDGDGILEPVLTTYLNGEIIQRVANVYETAPFFELDPYPVPYNWWGEGVADLLEDMQSLKTAIIKQIVINIAQNNDRKAVIDSSQTQAFQDLVDDKVALRMQMKAGEKVGDFIQWMPMNPLDPTTFSFLEYIQSLMENKTGITRYNQGLDARSLNKTATGISLIMQAANQRLELIARLFSQTGMQSLFEFLVEMNQKFMDQATTIRLTNKILEVRPDDIKGKFDVEVAAGVSIVAKDLMIQNLFTMLERVYPHAAPLGIVGAQEVYNLAKQILEQMGFANTSAFLKDPSLQPNVGGLAGMPQFPSPQQIQQAQQEPPEISQGIPAFNLFREREGM